MNGEERATPLLAECGPFAIVPTWLLFSPGVTDRAIRLYLILWSHTTEGRREAFPSRKTIGEEWDDGNGSTGVYKVDRAIEELIAVGGLKKRPQYRPGKAERSSNLYELVRSPRRAIWCIGCGGDRDDGCHCDLTTGRKSGEVVCKRTPRSRQMHTTWPANAHHGGMQMHTAEVEPSEVEQTNESQVASYSAASQAKTTSEHERRAKLSAQHLGGRPLPRQMPCDAGQFVQMMIGMSWECYSADPADITKTNYDSVKRYTKEIVDWLARHDMPIDPAYFFAFAKYYESLYNEYQPTPTPALFAKRWDDDGFWGSQSFYEDVAKYHKVLAEESTRLVVNYREAAA